MKVISLLQPWATLVVIGAKKIETRSRNCNYRGELLIHASLGKFYDDGNAKISCRELCYKEPFKKFINGGQEYDKLPFGAIIGKVNLNNTAPTWQFKDYVANWHSSLTDFMSSGVRDWKQEFAFGDYSNGRYGYFLSDPVQFANPVPAKGKQMIPWEFEMPDHIHMAHQYGGHATFDYPPDKETLDAVTALADAAYHKIKK